MASLELNEPVEKFKEFYGRNIDQMPELLKERRTPLGVAGLMRRRLEVLTTSKEVKDSWWTNYFDTGDAVIYHPDGRFKVVLNAEPMKELNPKSKLSNGALVLPEEMYDKLDGENFTREEVGKHGLVERLLTKEEAKENPIWKALAGGDQALLDSYINAVFKKAKEDYGYDGGLMRIWLSQPQGITTGQLWCIGGISSGSSSYYSDGNGSLTLACLLGRLWHGRLVGVAPEAH